MIVLAEHEDWSKLYGCGKYDNECVEKIRRDLKLRGCVATFHLHNEEGAVLAPSGQDIKTVYLLKMPDIIVHRDGFVIYKPKKDLDAKEVWRIDEECWIESEGDYWTWSICISSRLPVEKRVVRFPR